MNDAAFCENDCFNFPKHDSSLSAIERKKLQEKDFDDLDKFVETTSK